MATVAPTQSLPSVCPLDCPDACSLEVEVDGDRVVQVGGSRANPVTAGYICAKVRRLPEHVHGPYRVLSPRREGGTERGRAFPARFLGRGARPHRRAHEGAGAAGGGRADPARSTYGGSNGYLSQNTSDARLFNRLGALRLARTVCAAPSGRAVAGLYGTMPGIALQDYAAFAARRSLGHQSLLVRHSPRAVSSGSAEPAARSSSSSIRVRTRLAARADLHLALAAGDRSSAGSRRSPLALRERPCR